MASLRRQLARIFLFMSVMTVIAVLSAVPLRAAPWAAIVMDARTGEVLHAQNADTRLHPASLTKMMTLYIAFEAIQRGEITLDTMVTVTPHAAAQPPSRLGLRAGQRIAMRNLIRAAAIKSANDAAAAIGDAISGSEARFAERMNRTARALGMKNTTFRNAHGLTASGHLSTARDMNILGRRLFYDYPQYYNIFSRRTTDAGVAQVANTNRRFLDAYRGADGIKTGYTNAAGFNLTASAERGNKRIIATVFGGKSTAHRNAEMAKLMDLGFGAAPNNAPVRKPAAPDYGSAPALMAEAEIEGDPSRAVSQGKTVRVSTLVARSPRPPARPAPVDPAAAAVAAAALQGAIDDVVAQATAAAATPPPFQVVDEAALAPVAVAEAAAPAEPPPFQVVDAPADAAPVVLAEVPAVRPPPRPAEAESAPAQIAAAQDLPFEVVDTPPEELPFQLVATDPGAMPAPPADAAETPFQVVDAVPPPAPAMAGLGLPVPLSARPAARPDPDAPPVIEFAAAAPLPPQPLRVRPEPRPAEPEVVTRISTSGGRHWGVTLGQFNTRGAAERALMRTALSENVTLGEGLRKIVPRNGGFEANMLGLTQEQADLACRRLQARAATCFTIGP